MPIGTPVNLGSNSSASTSFTITTLASVAASDSVLVAVGCRAGTFTSVADARGNTYASDIVGGPTGGANVAIYRATITTPIVAGDLITIVVTGTLANFAAALAVSGLGSLDQTDSNGQFNTAAWTSTALTTTQASELVFGCSSLVGSATTSTPDAPQIELSDQTLISNSFTSTYRVVSSIGSYAASGTWLSIASVDQHSIVASYVAAPAIAAQFVPPHRAVGGGLW